MPVWMVLLCWVLSDVGWLLLFFALGYREGRKDGGISYGERNKLG